MCEYEGQKKKPKSTHHGCRRACSVVNRFMGFFSIIFRMKSFAVKILNRYTESHNCYKRNKKSMPIKLAIESTIINCSKNGGKEAKRSFIGVFFFACIVYLTTVTDWIFVQSMYTFNVYAVFFFIGTLNNLQMIISGMRMVPKSFFFSYLTQRSHPKRERERRIQLS